MAFTSENRTSRLAEVYSVEEIARAAQVPVARVLAFLSGRTGPDAGTVPSYVTHEDAVAAVRSLRSDGGRSVTMLFDSPEFVHTSPKLPIAVSSALHAGLAASLVLISAVGLPQAAERTTTVEPVTTRLVFIATPGPGGGGGGGGLRQKLLPPRAQRKGKASMDSPLPVRKPPKPVEPVPNPEPPPPPPEVKPEPLPPVVAPVATVAANEQDRPGVIDTPAPKESDSRGPGAGGGAGTGTGTGLGSGEGSGIGDGSGGGMGGGPYRPGSGIAPPRLLREVKAGYTEEARQRNLEGQVVLEIVVRRDGSVSDVKLVSGLPAGLNERAVAAVRQWRFAPATRLGKPVDVIVEVEVEFKLR
jgi:protein TonB